MRIAVVMDPIENVLVDKDTSFALMLEAQARGHEVLYLSHRDLWLEGDRLRAIVRPVSLQRAPWYTLTTLPSGNTAMRELSIMRSACGVLMRSDQPAAGACACGSGVAGNR